MLYKQWLHYSTVVHKMLELIVQNITFKIIQLLVMKELKHSFKLQINHTLIQSH